MAGVCSPLLRTRIIQHHSDRAVSLQLNAWFSLKQKSGFSWKEISSLNYDTYRRRPTGISRWDTRLHCTGDVDDGGTSVSTDERTSREKSTETSGHVKESLAKTVSNVEEVDSLQHPDQAAALKTVAFWACSAVAFGTVVGFTEGTSKASEFFAGYLLEQSLSVDNLFVFVLIFNYFQVPLAYQNRVLTYGIAGAIFFRATMILLGVVTLQAFEAVNLLFAGVLLFSSYKLLSQSDEDEEDLSNNFVVNLCQRFIPVSPDYNKSNFFTTINGVRMATPLLLTLAVVELSDIVFAVDSIPAVFGVTRDPFIVFSSNMFAILGLRSLYTVISGSMAELEYLQTSVACILGFIGLKMILDFFGLHIPTEASLGIVASTLGGGVAFSILLPSLKNEEKK